jgi:hypothetical protein
MWNPDGQNIKNTCGFILSAWNYTAISFYAISEEMAQPEQNEKL